jgi:tetratricopeptide (TPR) repeat protein
MNDVTHAIESATVDDRNPWLGLASFTEETQSFFHGREDEVAELARRVQRKLLTVLFGQSGLGKTSILRAGLVPRLRGQGYCPVYVRIAYGNEAPEPAEQIKEAIARTARRAGEWTQAGVAADGESLWEFMHHRDDVLQDAEGRPLIPLLIFDQFEEIFTLAQTDDFGRARAARFITDLADLVENRPPQSLEARLETDDSAAERFDFARSDYRVLIALREDYLAPLEGLKGAMPSITQNRLRLAPMTGTQALTAVMKPGKRLVTEDVAAAIVRFVAGGAELANADVEPSLLSLICRELNDTRIAQGRDEISLDLLAGSHATILTNFYERALVDQPAAVRRIIEDELLTASGFRENIAEERLIASFTAAGATPDTLALLVNRRLLRIEERLDVRRVELTHDVLCGVVKNSRDLRQERESREATERLLEEQSNRERATRRSLVRARQVAAICIVLAVGAVAAAIFAYLSTQRAQRAERLAEQTRVEAEQARTGAEHLLGYLGDDFYEQLTSFGRIDMISEFSKRQIDYFQSLPPRLRGDESIRDGANALTHHARAMRQVGKLDEGIKDATDSIQLLEGLQSAGDHSEATSIALALALAEEGGILSNRNNNAQALIVKKRAVAMLRPLADAPNSSPAVRRAFVVVLTRMGFEYEASGQIAACVDTLEPALKLAMDLGARDVKDIDMAANYAEAGAWYTTCLGRLGRNADALKTGIETLAVTDKVLAQRPGHRLALHAAQVTGGGLARMAQKDLNPAEALRFGLENERTSKTLLALDPLSVTSMNNLGVAHLDIADSLVSAGKIQESLPYYREALTDFGGASAGGAIFELIHASNVLPLAILQAQLGDQVGSAATLAAEAPFIARLRNTSKNDFVPALIEGILRVGSASVAFERGDLREARRLAMDAGEQIRSLKSSSSFEAKQVALGTYFAAYLAARASFLQGDYLTAERLEREALSNRKQWGTETFGDQAELNEISLWLGMALAKQGKNPEALGEIAPAVKFQRELAARNHGDVSVPVRLAYALYAQSLADPAHRAALLKESASLLDAAPPAVKAMTDTKLWRELVRQAQTTEGHSA